MTTQPTNPDNTLDQTTTVTPTPVGKNTKDSYEGRKHKPDIDGPQQDSQETDEVYSDPRLEENLPLGGVNAADLNAHDLSKDGNDQGK